MDGDFFRRPPNVRNSVFQKSEYDKFVLVADFFQACVNRFFEVVEIIGIGD